MTGSRVVTKKVAKEAGLVLTRGATRAMLYWALVNVRWNRRAARRVNRYHRRLARRRNRIDVGPAICSRSVAERAIALLDAHIARRRAEAVS